VADYARGEDVLTEARLTYEGLGGRFGVLVVEGPDDHRVFADRCCRPDQVVVAGNKPRLLRALEARNDQDSRRILFVADCDYDIPLRRIRLPIPGFIVTHHADVEADCVELGAAARVVADFLPERKRSTPAVSAVIDQAVAIAGAVGRFRMIAAKDGLPVRFDELQIRKFREPRSAEVDEARLGVILASRSTDVLLSGQELANLANGIEPDRRQCNGHDVLRALVRVLHDDHRIPLKELEGLPRMVRLSFSDEAFSRWSVTHRIRRWEQDVGKALLC
jgi:hypothetical protein